MRTGTRLTTLGLLIACLGACDRTASTGASLPQTSEAAPASVTPPTPEPSTSAADAGLAIAVARETAVRAALDQTLHVQQLLREEAREQRQAREAAQRGNGNERCLSGEKMRRVHNGWVQAGVC